MKNLILTAVLSVGLTVTSATADPVDNCYLTSSDIFYIAEARDAGIGPGVTFNLLIDKGFDPNLAEVLLEIVYISGSSLSPKDLRDIFFEVCIQELT